MGQEIMPTVILIDDDKAFLQVLGQNLERRCYDVSVATCIDEVKAILQKQKPDFAIVDLHLDSDHGLDVLDLIRTRSPRTIALVLSGYINVGTAAVATKRGAADCIVKPVSIEEIEHAMRTARTREEVPLPKILKPSDAQLQHIVSRWEKNDRNTSKTAEELGMHRRSLQRTLERAGIDRSDKEAGNSASRIEKLAARYHEWIYAAGSQRDVQ